jgi:hypothetical protein
VAIAIYGEEPGPRDLLAVATDPSYGVTGSKVFPTSSTRLAVGRSQGPV